MYLPLITQEGVAVNATTLGTLELTDDQFTEE